MEYTLSPPSAIAKGGPVKKLRACDGNIVIDARRMHSKCTTMHKDAPGVVKNGPFLDWPNHRLFCVIDIWPDFYKTKEIAMLMSISARELFLIVALSGIMSDLIVLKEFTLARRLGVILMWTGISLAVVTVLTALNAGANEMFGGAVTATMTSAGRVVAWAIKQAYVWANVWPAYTQRKKAFKDA